MTRDFFDSIFGGWSGSAVSSVVWNQLWQVTLVAFFVAVVVKLTCRTRPHLAHTLWLLVLIKCVTPPLWSSEVGVFSHLAGRITGTASDAEAGGPPSTVAGTTDVLPGEWTTAAVTAEPTASGASAEAPPVANEVPASAGAAQAAVSPTEARPTTEAASEPAMAVSEAAVPWSLAEMLFAAWLAGVAMCVALLLLRRLACAVALRRSRVAVDPRLEEMCQAVAARLGIRRRVRLVVTSRGFGPAISGVFRPLIVLPQRVLDGRERSQLETILAHELLHLRRGDTAIGLVQFIVQSVWWFHPLVWWANRQIVRERERCCDDEVVAGLGCEPADYAQTLLDVLKSARQPATLRAIPGLPGIRPVELTAKRLEHIMSPDARHGRNPWRHWLLLLILAAVFIPGAALSFPEKKDAKPEQVTLKLGADNKVAVLGWRISPDQIKPILAQVIKVATVEGKKPAVKLEVDGEALHENVVKLTEICSSLGIDKITMITIKEKPPEEKPTVETTPGSTQTRPPVTSAVMSALWEGSEGSRELTKHKGKANAVAWSTDGKLIVSGGSDSVVQVHDAKTGTLLSATKTENGAIWSVAFSPDTKRVVCGTNDGTVIISDVVATKDSPTGGTQLAARLTSKASEHEVWSVTFSPDSKLIAVGTKDARVQVYDAASGKQLFNENNNSQVSGIRFTPDGSMLVTSSVNEPPKLWNARTGKLIRKFEKAPTFQQWVAVSPDGKLVATASWGGESILWDLATGKLLRKFPGPKIPEVDSTEDLIGGFRSFASRQFSPHLNYVAFSPNGKLLASAGADGVIRLWGVRDGLSWGELRAHSQSAMSLSFSPDGKQIVTAGEDYRVRIWSVLAKRVPAAKKEKGENAAAAARKVFNDQRFGGLIGRRDPSRGRTVMPRWPTTNGLVQTDGKNGERLTIETVAPRGRIIALNWSPKGDRVACVDCSSVRIYEVPSFRLVRILPGHAVRNWGQPLAWSPDGETLATGGYDGTVRYWSVDGVPGPVMKAHGSPVSAVRWSPSGDRVASVGYYGGIRTWNADGSAAATVASSTHWLSSVAWSPDGKKLIVGELHRDASIWNATGGRVATLKFGAHVQSVAWNPKGDLVAVAGGRNEIDIWSVGENVEKLHTTKGHERQVASISWSPDGSLLASGAWDYSLRLWTRDGESRSVLTGHEDAVISVAWSPDGKTIASGDSSDSTIRLWKIDGQSGSAGPVLHGHRAYPTKIAWSPDGKRVALGGRGSDTNGRLDLWTVDGKHTTAKNVHEAGELSGLAWSPDSKRLATTGGGPAAHVWSADGEHLRAIFGHKRSLTDIDWSADGKWLATGEVGRMVRIRSADEDGEKGVGVQDQEVVDLEWHPKSGLVAAASKDNSVIIWKPDGSRFPPSIATIQYDGEVREVSWDQKGDRLVVLGSKGPKFFKADGSAGPKANGPAISSGSPDWNSAGQMLLADKQDTNLIQSWNVDGSGQNLVRGWGFAFHSPTWNADGSRFATGGSDKALHVFKSDGTSDKVLMGHHDVVTQAAWNSSANVIVSSGADNSVRCWDVASGKLNWVAVALRGHRAVTWNSRGELLAGSEDVANEEIVFVRSGEEGSSLATPSEVKADR